MAIAMGYSPLYFIEQTVKNLLRHKGMTITSVLVLIVCLLVTGSFYAVNENINYNLESFGQLNRILAYINEDCDEARMRAIKEEVEALENVKEVTLISKEQALQDEKDRLGQEYAEIFEWLEEGENPYRASLEIEYIAPEGVEELEAQIGQIEEIETVRSRADTAKRVTEIKQLISAVFYLLMGLLFLVSLFIIITTVRLAMSARSKEISVMRYVGASGLFIAIPFLLEGLVIGGAASLIAFFLQQNIYTLVAREATDYFMGLLSTLPASALAKQTFFGFLAMGLFTGLVGSSVSMIKHISD
ncbi:MAG: permease-like cell division protein FtsX [Clostridia bacterium]|nr:permease-like cell division protein FtsX [Clostridia bacterium]